MLDRITHAERLADGCPRAFDRDNIGPDFTNIRATIEVDEAPTPFGIVNGFVDVGGEEDGCWHIIEVRIPLEFDAPARCMRVLDRHSLDMFERVFAAALIGEVTDDMATDALRREMGE